MVLNAAGPWSEWLLDAPRKQKGQTKSSFPRCLLCYQPQVLQPLCYRGTGSHQRSRCPAESPGASLIHGAVAEYTLVGVWHVVWKDHPDQVSVREDEIQSFIDEINWAYPGLGITTKDVLHVECRIGSFRG